MGPKGLDSMLSKTTQHSICLFVMNFAEGKGRGGQAQLPRETKSVELFSCGYSLSFVQKQVLDGNLDGRFGQDPLSYGIHRAFQVPCVVSMIDLVDQSVLFDWHLIVKEGERERETPMEPCRFCIWSHNFEDRSMVLASLPLWNHLVFPFGPTI